MLKQADLEPKRTRWYTCALCSVFTAFKLMGDDELRPRDVLHAAMKLKTLKDLKAFGISNEEFLELAKLLGREIKLFQHQDFAEVWSLLRENAILKKPVIILPFNHAAVVYATTSQSTFLMDPDDLSHDFRLYSKERLRSYWIGVLTDFFGFEIVGD